MWRDRDGFDMRALALILTFAAALMAVIGVTAYTLLLMAGAVL